MNIAANYSLCKEVECCNSSSLFSVSVASPAA